MGETNIIDVYAVYGDSGNVGSGCLIGVFTEEKLATSAAVGRGNLDCGGDGDVQKRKAVQCGDEIYLLELDFSIRTNVILKADPRNYSQYRFCLYVKSINKPIDFMRVVRRKTGMTLAEVRAVYKKFQDTGEAKIEPFHDWIDATVHKEDIPLWKQELELNNIATIEAR